MKLRPSMPVVTELVNPSNLMFLLNKAEDYSIMKKFDITLVGIFYTTQYNLTLSLSYRLQILPQEKYTYPP